MALEGCLVSSKKPFKGPRRRQGSCWHEREKYFSQPGTNDFFTKRKQKIELVARPAQLEVLGHGSLSIPSTHPSEKENNHLNFK